MSIRFTSADKLIASMSALLASFVLISAAAGPVFVA